MGELLITEAGEEVELSNGIKIVNKSRIKIRVDGGWEGVKTHSISIKNIIEYYCYEANNIVSGCRTLGTITGDWRPVDGIAKECLNIFKIINIDKLRQVGKACGLEPKF